MRSSFRGAEVPKCVHPVRLEYKAQLWPAAGSVDSALGLHNSGLKSRGAQMSELRMAPARIVEALDVIEHVCAGGIAGVVGFWGGPFGLRRREEALHSRVVPDIADAAHRAGDAVVEEQALELLAGLTSPGPNDAAGRRRCRAARLPEAHP